MTALLVKDWKLLKGQRQFFMVIIGILCDFHERDGNVIRCHLYRDYDGNVHA